MDFRRRDYGPGFRKATARNSRKFASMRRRQASERAWAVDLRFEIVNVLAGHECLTVLYRNQRGRLVAETFEFGAEGEVVHSFACYD